jgi:hypothetical protein
MRNQEVSATASGHLDFYVGPACSRHAAASWLLTFRELSLRSLGLGATCLRGAALCPIGSRPMIICGNRDGCPLESPHGVQPGERFPNRREWAGVTDPTTPPPRLLFLLK